jgi:23S rRNA U2552 (ribose-2'-O)-methylase RlmE/FtsJ
MLQKSHFLLKYKSEETFSEPDLILGEYQIHEDLEDLSQLLNKSKNEIDKISNSIAWDYCKKLTNEYELIHYYIKNKPHNIGLTNYDPISRAFFKFWEIINDFDLLKDPPIGLGHKDEINYVALCEGPGGFIECFNYYRRIQGKNNDKIYAITLKSTTEEIPGWKKSNKIFNEIPFLKITYGEDETGNIYNINNILYLKDLIGQKVDLVTADGGFDVSDNYSHQEIKMNRLLFCEVVGGLTLLREGGNMVIKMFDSFYEFTIDLLFLLNQYFNRVIITKPFTSRPANSEKYLVCKGFKGISDEKLRNLHRLMWEWEILDEQNKKINRLFNFTIPIEFISDIRNCHLHFLFKQIKNILKTMKITSLELTNQEINEFKKFQVAYGILWCIQYKFPINLSCKYLSNDSNYNFIPNF